MQFAAELQHAALGFRQQYLPSSYLAVHIRRRDFIRRSPSASSIAQQLRLALAADPSLRGLFVATDAEVDDLVLAELARLVPAPVRFKVKAAPWSVGQVGHTASKGPLQLMMVPGGNHRAAGLCSSSQVYWHEGLDVYLPHSRGEVGESLGGEMWLQVVSNG